MSLTVELALSERAAGRSIALRLAEVIAAKPAAVIGVATGSSPEPIYAALADLVRDGLDASQVTWFALDEYLGLPASHPQSYRSVLERALIRPLGLDPASLHVPAGLPATADADAEAYERLIGEAQVDVQILGIGHNGHIGFNEPGTPFTSTTHRAVLTSTTRKANARCFDSLDLVPRECLTQGIATIMRAGTLELIASGAEKAPAVARALRGPVSEDCPASVVNLHGSVRVTVDADAASLLSSIAS